MRTISLSFFMVRLPGRKCVVKRRFDGRDDTYLP